MAWLSAFIMKAGVEACRGFLAVDVGVGEFVPGYETSIVLGVGLEGGRAAFASPNLHRFFGGRAHAAGGS